MQEINEPVNNVYETINVYEPINVYNRTINYNQYIKEKLNRWTNTNQYTRKKNNGWLWISSRIYDSLKDQWITTENRNISNQ